MKIKTWTSGKFDVKEQGGKGKGAYANRIIRKGEVIGIHGGIVVHESEIERLKLVVPEEKLNLDHAMYIYPGFLLLHDYENGCDPMCFINHSCSPNARVVNGVVMVALRDIPEGEEIGWDYRQTDNLGRWEYEFKCECGTPGCVGVVRVGPKHRKEISASNN
jgi:SET domain-containing protein